MRINKLGLFIILIMIMFSICIPVKAQAATRYSVELIGNSTVKQGEKIEIIIKLKDILDSVDGIAGLSAKLEYDTTKLEKQGDTTSVNGFFLAEGENIELVKIPGVTQDTEIAKLTFKVKDSAEGTTWVKLTQVEAADGTNKFPLGTEVRKDMTIVAKENPKQDEPKDDTTGNKKDETTPDKGNNTKLPQTGIDSTSIIAIVVISAVAIVSFVSYRRYRDI